MDQWQMCVYVQDELMNYSYYEIDTINPHVLYFHVYDIEKQNLLHPGNNHVGMLQKCIVTKMSWTVVCVMFLQSFM